MPSTAPILSCRNVWKIFGKGAERFLAEHQSITNEQLESSGLIGAVRDATITVYEGEIFVIMGLSGSGKSTLLRCLSRLIEPTGGEIMFEGRNLLQQTEKQMVQIRRHKMGMVFQHFALMPHLTVLENVAFPLEIQGVDRTERDKRARKVIELVGLEDREAYFPRELSGGQQQRVGIARSLSVEPKIWFLDEPFSALDPLIRREMQDEFLSIQSKLSKTIVFITHDFNEAVRLADRIAIMKDGSIIQIGTPEELILQPSDQYVEEFTYDLSRARVFSTKTVMTEKQDGTPAGGQVLETVKIQDMAKDIIQSDLPFDVIDADGSVVGQITKEAVLGVLVDTDQRSSADSSP